MASVMFGGGVSAAVGSHGGNTFARNKAGSHVRKRTKGVAPQTSRQRSRQVALSLVAKAWFSQLSAGQRAAWRAYASSNPVLNRLGQSTVLSGQQAFVKLGAVQQLTGFGFATVPPVVAVIASPTSISPIMLHGGGGSVTIQPLASGSIVNQQAYVWASSTYSPGRAFISSGMRFLGGYTLNVGAPTTVTTDYTNVFGSLRAVVGGTIFWRMAIQDYTSGLLGPYIQEQVAWT